MSDNTPEATDESTPTLVVSDKLYDALRFMAVIVLPALGALYFGLANVLGLPAAEQVVGTITVLDTFLGVLVRTMRKSYEKSDARFDGAIHIAADEEEGVSNLNVSLDPLAVATKDEVLVKVRRA
jgi:hypothetical protein